jgi:hypothetical protein
MGGQHGMPLDGNEKLAQQIQEACILREASQASPNTSKQDAYHPADGGSATRGAGIKNSSQSIEICAGDAQSVTSPAKFDAGLPTGSKAKMRTFTWEGDKA